MMLMSSSRKMTMKSSSSFVPTAVLLFGMLFLTSPLSVLADFDFYYFVLMWPGTYCEQSKCCHPTTGNRVQDFLIRSLQPTNISYETDTKCRSESLYTNKLDNLMDYLNTYWSNIKCPSNNGMSAWKSTWKTYGTCTGLDEYNYFYTALVLRHHIFDLLSILKNNGITPDISQEYSLTSIKEAIAKGIGAKPQIKCNSKNQLYEVYICLDKAALTTIECPEDLGFTCATDIYFPPVNQTKLNHTMPNFDKDFMARKIIMPISLE
ncbi:extracellular ribonuclease LE-like [Dioscorea cayenensis subsp. rotundata]|uniref:Extracellular ribonuclease LE-like n=1 Tax=Dioscorea cayennensis subsp. rotundata TaxID=55577 RepID=A0AB40AV97_DIOCR|nr:extracellular ribonuclease LE-like [Dioscorea cayenensis subsp. rotundata]